jgi:protein SCO1/2
MTNNDTPRKSTVSLVIALAVAAGLGAWFLFSSGPSRPPVVAEPPATQQALVMPEFRALKPFSLTNHKGETFDNKSLLGHWTFMSFGYTFCPDICPTTLSTFARMHELIQAKKSDQPYQVVFVSVDPERDTLERLGDYVTYFDPSFIGVTGTAEALQQLTMPLGIIYERVETEDSAMGYVMDHSASIILVDPQGRFHAYFSPPHEAEMMADDFIAISAHEE